MSAPPPFPPAAWTNQPIVLYHGTTLAAARAIDATGVKKTFGSPLTDFGKGFYTTTLLRQAITWAHNRAALLHTTPGYVKITVNRDELSKPATLAFVRGSFDAEDFWSLVFHCRHGNPGHKRPLSSAPAISIRSPGEIDGDKEYYDVVYGPVSAFWQQRLAIQDVDQVSFHTNNSIALLNRSPRKSYPC
jgi:hypothetical protein